MTIEQGSGKPDLPAQKQWELALASLRRAQESTNHLRILIFVAALGLIALVLPEIRALLPRAALLGHLGALVLSALSVCLLVYGWQVQRTKAREQFTYLRDGNYAAYVQYDKAVETISGRRDSRLDGLALIVLVAAFALELAARILALAAHVPPPVVPGVHV